VKARLVLATLLDDDDDVDLEFNLIKNTVQQERVRILTYASLNPPGRQYVLPLFLVFDDFGQTNYLAIYQTDLRHVLSGLVELWLSMNDLKLVFRSLKGRCHRNQF